MKFNIILFWGELECVYYRSRSGQLNTLLKAALIDISPQLNRIFFCLSAHCFGFTQLSYFDSLFLEKKRRDKTAKESILDSYSLTGHTWIQLNTKCCPVSGYAAPISVDICSFTSTDTCTAIELKDVLPLLVQSMIGNGKITGYSSPMLIFDLKIVVVVQQKQKLPDYNCKIASIDVYLLHPVELWHQMWRAILLDGRPLFLYLGVFQIRSSFCTFIWAHWVRAGFSTASVEDFGAWYCSPWSKPNLEVSPIANFMAVVPAITLWDANWGVVEQPFFSQGTL